MQGASGGRRAVEAHVAQQQDLAQHEQHGHGHDRPEREHVRETDAHDVQPVGGVDRGRERDRAERDAEDEDGSDHQARQALVGPRVTGAATRHEDRAHAEGPDPHHGEGTHCVARTVPTGGERHRRDAPGVETAQGRGHRTEPDRHHEDQGGRERCGHGAVATRERVERDQPIAHEVGSIHDRLEDLRGDVGTEDHRTGAEGEVSTAARQRHRHDRGAEERQGPHRDRLEQSFRPGCGPRVLDDPTGERGVVEPLPGPGLDEDRGEHDEEDGAERGGHRQPRDHARAVGAVRAHRTRSTHVPPRRRRHRPGPGVRAGDDTCDPAA